MKKDFETHPRDFRIAIVDSRDDFIAAAHLKDGKSFKYRGVELRKNVPRETIALQVGFLQNVWKQTLNPLSNRRGLGHGAGFDFRTLDFKGLENEPGYDFFLQAKEELDRLICGIAQRKNGYAFNVAANLYQTSRPHTHGENVVVVSLNAPGVGWFAPDGGKLYAGEGNPFFIRPHLRHFSFVKGDWDDPRFTLQTQHKKHFYYDDPPYKGF